MPEIPDVDQFIQSKNIIDLGLIHDVSNLMSKQAKQGVALLAVEF